MSLMLLEDVRLICSFINITLNGFGLRDSATDFAGGGYFGYRGNNVLLNVLLVP